MLSWLLRLQIMETYSFCLLNLVGLVKCLAEFRERLLEMTGKTTAEKMSARPPAKIMLKL